MARTLGLGKHRRDHITVTSWGATVLYAQGVIHIHRERFTRLRLESVLIMFHLHNTHQFQTKQTSERSVENEHKLFFANTFLKSYIFFHSECNTNIPTSMLDVNNNAGLKYAVHF